MLRSVWWNEKKLWSRVLGGKNAVNTITAVNYIVNKYAELISVMDIKVCELIEYKELGAIK